MKLEFIAVEPWKEPCGLICGTPMEAVAFTFFFHNPCPGSHTTNDKNLDA